VPVSLVITELDIGGAEKALVNLATRLDRTRWRPSVIALGPEGPLAQPIRESGLTVDCLGVDPRRPVVAIRRLASTLRRHDPALVQSFLFHANVAARVAALWAGRPRPWVLGGLRVAERQKRWHLWLDRMTARLSTGAVCVSEGVRRFSRDLGGWPDDRLTVIPNGIDVALFDFDAVDPVPRDSLEIPPGSFLVLYVGRLHVQKGLPILLDAFEQVIDSRPDHDCHLALAGDGPERDRLQNRVEGTSRLRGRVHLLGPRSDVPALLKAADLLVLPSIWEGMPNAVLEAMASRRAVVATRVEGSEDLVEPGKTGWLVPPGDPDALARALLDAASDRVRLRHFGELGRARVESKFTIEETVLGYERLWARILGFEDRS
jgi:glycosyltransferase involved in cell wall biosynthesis